MTTSIKLNDPAYVEVIRVASHELSHTYWVIIDCPTRLGVEINISNLNSKPKVVLKDFCGDFRGNYDIYNRMIYDGYTNNISRYALHQQNYLLYFLKNISFEELSKFLITKRKILTEFYSIPSPEELFSMSHALEV